MTKWIAGNTSRNLAAGGLAARTFLIRAIPKVLLVTFCFFAVLSTVLSQGLAGSATPGISRGFGRSASAGGACSLSAPTPIFPSGSASPTPTYTWTAVAGAEQYQLWVDDSSAAGKIRAWYTASEAGCSSGGGTCSVTPAVSLASGPAQFSVRAWASCDGGIYSSWSDSMRFSIGGGGENFITQVLGLYPVNNATPGGTAVLAAQVQNNFSAAMPANAAVSFHVFGTGIDTIVGSTSISGLTPGNMNVYSYSWTIPSSLSPGVYSYRARVYIGITAISEWSSWQGFTINSGGGGGYAAQVTQILPVDDAVVGGSVTLGAEVVNTGSLALPSDATVRFWVSGLSDNWVGSASAAGLAAGARGVHSFIWHIPASLEPGNYTYYAQVFSGSTTAISEWSSGQEFLIRSGYFRAQVMQLAPVIDTVAGTSATLRADVKNTGSLPLPSNAAVWFWVSGLSNSWVGSAPAAGLGAGSDSWYSFIWKTPADLTPGAYTLYAQVWTDVAISEWNSGLSFNITGGGLPGKATLISPAGSSASSSPTYRWNAVSNAAWYYLWVSDSSSGQRITAWYTADQAGCASGSGACSVTPAVTLAQGACQWWIQTWNETGYGPWSDAMSFTAESGVTPGAAILVSPTGTITTATPAYTWYAVQGSTWYLLWVNDSAGSGKINKWYTAEQAGCLSGFGTCSVQPDTPLAQGAAQWWVQTWFSSGAGPWSDGMSFAVGNSGVGP